jgi:hypothetical protein
MAMLLAMLIVIVMAMLMSISMLLMSRQEHVMAVPTPQLLALPILLVGAIWWR